MVGWLANAGSVGANTTAENISNTIKGRRRLTKRVDRDAPPRTPLGLRKLRPPNFCLLVGCDALALPFPTGGVPHVSEDHRSI